MLRQGSFSRLWMGLPAVFVLVCLPALWGASPEPPELVMTVPDTTIPRGQTGALLNIYMSNYFDTVAGFQFVLVSEHPDLVSFNFDNDGFDTSGTLTSGFEYAQAIDRAGDQSEVWFRCLANLPFDTVNNWGFSPQQGGVAVKIPINTAAVTDSILTSLLTVTTPVDFSNPWGYSIGVVTETLYDTSFFLCLLWEDDTCTEWIEVDPDTSEFDSLYVDITPYGYLDTTRVIINEGSITVQGSGLTCDYDDDGTITVGDLMALVGCLFGMPPPPPEFCEAGRCDADGSGATDVGDLTYLVTYLFQGGPPPQ
ncbi:MAG: hypothetical protein ABII79_02060 [bacterium]